ncbi:unnamed protein product [Soboliphyme baturini]|uniref:Uncharacterized protein n=1 Tax=Soboliphyme baturini TaxID=241478 RepID=A0A183J1K7_9BILA|nr:unnamed protein product [Soboliphyme baturini]
MVNLPKNPFRPSSAKMKASERGTTIATEAKATVAMSTKPLTNDDLVPVSDVDNQRIEMLQTGSFTDRPPSTRNPPTFPPTGRQKHGCGKIVRSVLIPLFICERVSVGAAVGEIKVLSD